MLHVQKLITGLALLFLVAGLVIMLTFKTPTSAAIVDLKGTKAAELFCYKSYLCQSGIECMYLQHKEPFCSQPAVQAMGINQKFGVPCQLIENKVKCSLTQH